MASKPWVRSPCVATRMAFGEVPVGQEPASVFGYVRWVVVGVDAQVLRRVRARTHAAMTGTFGRKQPRLAGKQARNAVGGVWRH